MNKAIEMCKINDYTLVTSKVDRLCRSVDQIIDLERAGIHFEIAELGGEQSRFMMFINASVAEEESRLISERTQKAMLERSHMTKNTARQQFILRHKPAAACGLNYWKEFPSAPLTAIVAELKTKNIINPATSSNYTYSYCYRLFGKSLKKEKNSNEQLIRSFITDVYTQWYENGLFRTNDSASNVTIDFASNVTIDFASNVLDWISYIKSNDTIQVSKLVKIPLNSRLLECLKGKTLIAKDIPETNAVLYYRALVNLLPTEGNMRQNIQKSHGMFELSPSIKKIVTQDTIYKIQTLYGTKSTKTLAMELNINSSTLEQIYKTTLSLENTKLFVANYTPRTNNKNSTNR
jgi:hypothetical protein